MNGTTIIPIILAAGKGTRMKSNKLKVFHEIGGRPMIHYILDMITELGVPAAYAVVGDDTSAVRSYTGQLSLTLVEQKEKLGTGHAVMQVAPSLKEMEGHVLVLNGDVPLITARTIDQLVGMHLESDAVATVLTAVVDDPTGYGRIIRGAHGSITRIVEQKDGTVEELKIREINTGIYCFEMKALFSSLKELRPTNVQGEYYLTDTIGILKAKRLPIFACRSDDSTEVIGVNSRQDLAIAEKILQRRTVGRLMREGVTIIDPDATYIDPVVKIGRDTVIHPFSFIKGRTEVGDDCQVGPNATLQDAMIRNGAAVRQSDVIASVVGEQASILRSVIINSHVAKGAQIGPFHHVVDDVNRTVQDQVLGEKIA